MVRRIFIIIFFLPAGMEIAAQLSGNNLMEYQLGNLPYTEPASLSSHYDQLNLAYRYKGLKASMRYEHFFSQNEGSSYYRISQFQLRYRKGKMDLKVGNFNETLGFGLLVRGYDIAGSVFEEASYRTRYGFYRDMLGFSAKYSGDIWYFHGMRGTSLVNTLPPTLDPEDRRVDLVEGMETGIQLYGQRLGMVLMRNSNSLGNEVFYSLLASGSWAGRINYGLEYARSLDPAESYGFYGSLGLSLGSFGLSFEYKNYHQMLIGSGISDPPTAVKEQKYKVLNRSIHVPILDDEEGFQLEAYYSFSGGEHLLVNYTRAVNELFTTFRFNEVFLELAFTIGQRNDASIFADFSMDEFKAEDRRYATGLVWDYAFSGSWSANFHAEYQYILRNALEPMSIHNGVVILGLSRSQVFSVSALWELSTDPLMTDHPDSPEVETATRYWPGIEGSYRINNANTLSLFVGKRRGGPACTSGICYEVLDFEGIEIRLKTKF